MTPDKVYDRGEGALPRNFGWNAVKLSEHSIADLTRLREAVEADPKSANTAGGIYLYNKPARRKLDAIGWAIYHKQREARTNTTTGHCAPGELGAA